jgi:hypothetical protein
MADKMPRRRRPARGVRTRSRWHQTRDEQTDKCRATSARLRY